ncbi:hypothetical protein U9R90_18655 [Streptomyces sp. E11-3]
MDIATVRAAASRVRCALEEAKARGELEVYEADFRAVPAARRPGS